MTIAQIKAAIASLTAPLTLSALKSMLDLMADEQRPYKVYTALLTQTGTDAPVATILENTIGNIVWSYTGGGNYLGTLTAAFVVDKTFVIIGNGGDGQPASVEPILAYRSDADAIGVETAEGNDILDKTSIEIRVYE